MHCTVVLGLRFLERAFYSQLDDRHRHPIHYTRQLASHQGAHLYCSATAYTQTSHFDASLKYIRRTLRCRTKVHLPPTPPAGQVKYNN